MKKIIIISPSKTQSDANPLDPKVKRPHTLDMAREIFKVIRGYSLEQTKEIYSLSDAMAKKVYDMHQEHGKKLFYAIEMFSGEVFKQLKLDEYDKD